MEEFFSSFLRHAGMPASAGLSCFYLLTGIRYFSILQMELLVGIMASLISEKYNRMLKI